MQFDHNGVRVRQSQPVSQLRKLRKVITIDSRDRDPTKFVKVNGGTTVSDPGDYVVYLPRVYENVTSIRLMSAEIQAPETDGFAAADTYILVALEGLNKMDETAEGANRSGNVDSIYAKIPLTTNGSTGITAGDPVFYSDRVSLENITQYSPPLGRLDRFHITFRRHLPLSSVTTVNPTNTPITFGTSENSLTFEIEYLDNGFNSVSTFETMLNAHAC
jgi:hypothetical protein